MVLAGRAAQAETRPAPGAPARPGRLDVRARYEDQLVERALVRHGLTEDKVPQGKIIERIVIAAHDLVLPGELPLSRHVPWTLVNKIHVRTRDYIIRQELLFREGDRLRDDLMAESSRNLRTLFVLAIARIVAAKGSAPDRAVVLVVTKDLWSLRLNSDFTLDQGRLDYLSFVFSENNLAGRNKTLGVRFALNPGGFTYTVGLTYSDPRIWSSRHQLGLSGSLFINRQTSEVEGGSISLTVGRPLFSLRTRFGWAAQISHFQDRFRGPRGGDIYNLCFSPDRGVLSDSDRQNGCKEGEETLPDVYSRSVTSASLSGARSFGVVRKLNLSAGFRLRVARYRIPSDFPEVSAAAARAYVAYLPRSESYAGPYLSLQAFRADFVRLKNIETFALSEDVRVGPALGLEVQYANPNFGFSSHFLELSGSYRHTFFFGGNLLTFAAGFGLRIQDGVHRSGLLVNEEVSASLRNVSPQLGPLRIHVALRVQIRNRDLDNSRIGLGVDSGLRGYPARWFRGNSLYVLNVEVRTLALNLWTIHVGGVLFYDGGDAPRSLSELGWHHDAGLGARILIPQFNKVVLRLDLAFPFEQLGARYEPRFSAGWEQAF